MGRIMTGSFTATGAPYALDLVGVPQKFEMYNQTNMNSTANPGVVKKVVWFDEMASDSAYLVKNTNGAATDQSSRITSGGISPYTGEAELGPSIPGTGINQANPAVVTVTSHGLTTGDVVRVYGTTAMLQVAGMDFVVTVTGANTFTIPLNTSGFAAAASAISIRKHIVPPQFVPLRKYITGITQASSAVITTSINHGFSTGDVVTINVPAGFGMSQINGQQGTVTSLTDTTFSVNINSSSYTAFAFPASGAAPFTFAEVVPVSGPFNNSSFQGIVLGSTVCGAASDVIQWIAEFADN
jgi:hypothetical protein